MSVENNTQNLGIKSKQLYFKNKINDINQETQEFDTKVGNFAVSVLCNLYDNCADILDEYDQNRGIANAGKYIEQAKKIVDWATFGAIKSTAHRKENLKNKTNELKKLDITNPEEFKRKFKEISGIEYNEDNIKKLMILLNQENVDTESDEFKECCQKAFGIRGTDKEQKYVKYSSTVDGIGDIVVMLVSLGAISKTKMMGKLTTSLFKSLEKTSAKFLSKNKAQKTAKIGTSMLMGGVSLAGFTMTKETLDNITNPLRDAKSLSTWKQTGIAGLESFGFGAFGGLLNETVIAPLVKYLSQPAKQAAQAVSNALSKGAEINGKEVLQAAIKSQNFNLSGLFKMNEAELKAYSQMLGAHAAGFGVEVLGFAGYEAGLDAIKDICDPQTGRLPEHISLATLTQYLVHKIGEQFSNLGTIKGISQLLMMRKGGKTAQQAMMNKMLAESEKLSEIKFKKINDNGNETIEMTLPDGSKKQMSNAQQAIQACETIIQTELVINCLKSENDHQEIKEEPIEQTENIEENETIKSSEDKTTTEEVTTENETIQESNETVSEKINPSLAQIIANQKLKIQKATETDFTEIQKIDLEAFNERYEIKTDIEDYKNDLAKYNIETYTIKSEDGTVIGYYQLEPVQNGELYIHSIGIKNELRNTKISYKALKLVREEIATMAKEQNLDKITLDVDANKPELVKLYKKFGFEITGENSGYEAGNHYKDYHMEADVKKVLNLNETQNTTAKTEELQEIKTNPTPEETAEVKEPEKIENVQEVEKTFFEIPKSDKNLQKVTIDGNTNRYGKIIQKDGKDFINIDGVEYEIRKYDNDSIPKMIFANDLYNKAGFAQTHHIMDIDGKQVIIKEPSVRKPYFAIEKLEQDFDINIFVDEAEVGYDGISFFKNGKTVKLKIIDENTTVPNTGNTENNTIYITTNELKSTLRKFVNLDRYCLSGDRVVYHFKDGVFPQRHDLAIQFRERIDFMKELYEDLTPQTETEKELKEITAQNIRSMKFNENELKRLNQFLEMDIETKYKDYKNLKDIYLQRQRYLKEAIEANPELTKYLAEMFEIIERGEDVTNITYEKKSPRNDSITSTERAACYVKIVQALTDKNSYYCNGHLNMFDSIKEIPTGFLEKCVFKEGITSPKEIADKWEKLLKQRNEELSLDKYISSDKNPEVVQDIIKKCLDSYGEICDYKVETAKKLMALSPEFSQKYGSYYGGGPYSATSEILSLCSSREECAEVLDTILPLLKKNNLDYSRDKTAFYVRELKDISPEERNFKIEVLKLIQKNNISYYNSIPESLSTPEHLKLYNELVEQGYNPICISTILTNRYNYPFKTMCPEMIEFTKSLKYFEDKGIVSLNALAEKFSYQYANAINDNNFEEKQNVIRQINLVAELLTNKSRNGQPIPLDIAVIMSKVPQDKYQQIHDIVFLKDVVIPLAEDRDIYRLIRVMSDDTNVQHFYQDYLPLIRKYPQHYLLPTTPFIEQLLLAEYEKANQEIVKKDYETTLKHMKYLLENTPAHYWLVELSMLDEHQFNRIKSDLTNIKSLGTNQLSECHILDIAQLEDYKYDEFVKKLLPRLHKLFPNKTVNHGSNANLYTGKYLDLSPEQLDNIIEAVEYFSKNYKMLEAHDIELTPEVVSNFIHENHTSVISIIDLTDISVLKHALGMKYKGFHALLENTKDLSELEPQAKELLRQKLELLPHPELKLDKLLVISSLVKNVKSQALLDIIQNIKSPKMTQHQQELADKIFAETSIPYERRVENFIREFNVPYSKQKIIREFLLKQKITPDKYITPPTIEKQLEIIEKKIQSINENNKIPTDKKEQYLKILHKQKTDLLANPEKYTKRRINENVMKTLAAQVEAHINIPNNTKDFNKLINKEIYKIYDIEITDDLLNADIEFDSKYFSKLFSNDTSFTKEFKKFIELIKSNPNKKWTEIIKTLPTNKATQQLFEQNGLDYNRWINFDENSYKKFKLSVNSEKVLQSAKNNLKAELQSELAKKLDANSIMELTQILQDMDIEHANQKQLALIIKAIESNINSNPYWKSDNPDIKTFRDHIAIHKKNIHGIEKIKDLEEELYVRLWDKNDIGRNLFFGNHVGCCTSIGKCNSFAAVQHLTNSFVNGIEIVDKGGNSVGNSMCYFAKVDGQLTFVIDSFEAQGKLGASPEVTDAIIDYAKQICKEMGQPDANIMFGPNYNKLDFSRCLKTNNHTVEVIGRADEMTYIDAVGGPKNINVAANSRDMYEIINL